MKLYLWHDFNLLGKEEKRERYMDRKKKFNITYQEVINGHFWVMRFCNFRLLMNFGIS